MRWAEEYIRKGNFQMVRGGGGAGNNLRTEN